MERHRYLLALTAAGETRTVVTMKMQVWSAPPAKLKFLDFCCCALPDILLKAVLSYIIIFFKHASSILRRYIADAMSQASLSFKFCFPKADHAKIP